MMSLVVLAGLLVLGGTLVALVRGSR